MSKPKPKKNDTTTNKEAEKELKAVQAELEQLRVDALSEQEKTVEAARSDAAAATRSVPTWHWHTNCSRTA